MIEITGLKKVYQTSFGTVTALDNINLRLPNRGFVSIYGENGCGKTTLLNAISSLDVAYEGSIFYNGVDCVKHLEYYRGKIVSFVFQEFFFVPYLNLEENINYFLPDDAKSKSAEFMTLFGIEDKKFQPVINLSGGQKQRAALVRGLLKECWVVLVDEPTSSLNEEMEREVFERLRSIANEKLVLLVSHNIKLIRKYSDLIIRMDKGTISSLEENKIAVVKSEDNVFFIPKMFQDLSFIPADGMKEVLSTYGNAVIRYRNDECMQQKLDYSLQKENVEVEKKQFFWKRWWLVAKKSLWFDKRTFLSDMCMVGFLLVLVIMLCSLVDFDKTKFTYEALHSNVDGFVNFKKSQTVEVMETVEEDPLSYEKVLALQRSGTDVRIRFDYELPMVFPVPFLGMQEGDIYGISCCCDPLDPICGSIQGLMVTDYTADGLLTSKEYASYEEIMEKGITIGETHIQVSGIIDTDYEKYLAVYQEESFVNSQGYLDYRNDVECIYARFYYTVETFCNSMEICGLQVESGALLADMVCREDMTFSDGKVKINRTLMEQSDYLSYIKLGVLSVDVEEVVEEELGRNVIFVSPEVMEQFCQSRLSNVEALSIVGYDKEMIDFLLACNMVHQSSISGYIEQTIDIINILRKLLIIIIGIILTIFMAFTLRLQRNMLRQDQFAIVALRMNGFPWREVWAIEGMKSLLILATTLILTAGVSVGCSDMLKFLLRTSVGFSTGLSFAGEKEICVAGISCVILYVILFIMTMQNLCRKNLLAILRN